MKKQFILIAILTVMIFPALSKAGDPFSVSGEKNFSCYANTVCDGEPISFENNVEQCFEQGQSWVYQDVCFSKDEAPADPFADPF